MEGREEGEKWVCHLVLDASDVTLGPPVNCCGKIRHVKSQGARFAAMAMRHLAESIVTFHKLIYILEMWGGGGEMWGGGGDVGRGGGEMWGERGTG